jgi:elongation factor G
MLSRCNALCGCLFRWEPSVAGIVDVPLSRIRNIGIAAHIDAGKTTTTERILYYTGRTHRMGNVEEGTTITDFDVEEQQRGITIYSAAVSCPWKDHTINLIDTPGHVDFTAEVERSLRVLDGAVAVFDAKEGVEAQSETVWRQADRYNVPRICFINKMDKVGADFFASFRSIRQRLGARPVAIHIPIGAEADFRGLIDLMAMKAVYYDVQEEGSTFEETDIPRELRPLAEEWRHHMVELICEINDDLMERYLADKPIDAECLRPALRQATINNALNPVLCGSALDYIGVQRLLDAVVDYLPSPLDLPPVTGLAPEHKHGGVARHCDPTEPFSGLVFKVVSEKPVDLYFLRIYSGTLDTGTRVLNANRGKKENISRIFRIFAKKRQQLQSASAGDIVAVVGLRHALTGDTLCAPKHPVVFEHIKFPEPVISLAIEPRSSADRDRLGEALNALSRQDPTFTCRTDKDTNQRLISGMGELHLEVLVNRLQRDMGVQVHVGRPRVSYRETITRASEAEGRFIRQTGGAGQYAICKLRVEPFRPGEGERSISFVSTIRGGAVRREYIPAVEAGVRESAHSGPIAGYPMINLKITLLDGRQHEVDSSELAFENAGRLAFQAACEEAGPQLLEPIMQAEVITPDRYFGPVQSDLIARRASITNTELRGESRVIEAQVPLAEMFGYATALRSLTQGRGNWTMEPETYAPVPEHVAEVLLATV